MRMRRPESGRVHIRTMRALRPETVMGGILHPNRVHGPVYVQATYRQKNITVLNILHIMAAGQVHFATP